MKLGWDGGKTIDMSFSAPVQSSENSSIQPTLLEITLWLILPLPSCRFQTVTQMVRVWRNECLRVFHDRLINETDKELVSTLKKYQQMQQTNKQTKNTQNSNKQKAKL